MDAFRKRAYSHKKGVPRGYSHKKDPQSLFYTNFNKIVRAVYVYFVKCIIDLGEGSLAKIEDPFHKFPLS